MNRSTEQVSNQNRTFAGIIELTILALGITEVLSDRKTSQGDTGTGTRGLVHLTEHKGDLGLAVKLNDGSLLHLVVQVTGRVVSKALA